MTRNNSFNYTSKMECSNASFKPLLCFCVQQNVTCFQRSGVFISFYESLWQFKPFHPFSKWLAVPGEIMNVFCEDLMKVLVALIP